MNKIVGYVITDGSGERYLGLDDKGAMATGYAAWLPINRARIFKGFAEAEAAIKNAQDMHVNTRYKGAFRLYTIRHLVVQDIPPIKWERF